jgi:four helix bundle protein
MPVNKFEDLEVWKLARELAQDIYKYTAVGEFSKDYGLKDQMRRAAISIMSNIAEGFERNGNREFKRFLVIAKGSAGELKSQSYIAHDINYLSHEQFSVLYEAIDKVGRKIGSLIKTIK